MDENILEVRGLTKKYGGIVALKGIHLDIRRNAVHCIIGENGAGKSTFIKILTGTVPRNSGEVIYDGQKYFPRTIRDAMDCGMNIIFQELNVIDQLTVEENLTLGIEKTKFGVIYKTAESSKVFQVLKNLEPGISFKEKVFKLSVAQKQIIEITKAIANDAKVIIMDEPTASLSENEVRRLFRIIKNIKSRNVTIIYISHKLEEIFEIGDWVTVFRDGAVVETKKLSEVTDCAELIKMMTGKVIADDYVYREVDYSQKILEVQHLNTDKLHDIQFDLFKGEILGFYGLVGSGKTEIARALYKADRVKKIFMKVLGKTIPGKTPKDMINRGLSLLPEERRTEGLFLKLPIRDNIGIMSVKKFSRHGITNKKRETIIAASYLKKLNIVARDVQQTVASLSGGNQQKVVVAKCLSSDSNIILMDEPTRGVDVGAKKEIHTIIRDLSREGKSIVVFSSELQEIINLCDRIILLYEGKIKAVGPHRDVNVYQIMSVVTGGNRNENDD